MTEKERPSFSQPDHIQSSYYQPEDEISLLDLLEVLVRKKVLIFVTASIFTVLSVFYTFSVTPIYRATIGFQPYGKSLAALFPGFTTEFLPDVSRRPSGPLKQNYMLNEFITEFQSYSNQEKVFIEGKFLQRFVANSPNIDMRKGIVQEIYRSIHASDKGTELSAQTVVFEMEGTKPEVISDFLNALADLAKSKAKFDVKESMQKGIKAQLDKYSAELKKIRSIEKAVKAEQIRQLSENLEIAKNLGILDNNFDGSTANATFLFGEKEVKNSARLFGERPGWYLYGQRAIEQESKVLEHRGVSSQYTEETAELDYKIAYLSSIDLSKINFEPVIISQVSIPPVHPINLDRMRIIAIGIVLGLFIGIVMAFLSYLIAKLTERSKLSPPR